MRLKFITTTAFLSLMGGCASKPHTAPGIQPIERKVLTEGYYWEPGKDPKHFTDAKVRAIIEESSSIGWRDGERTELYRSRLALALASSGDEHFASLLQEYPQATRDKVLKFTNSMWSYHKLEYPVTQALATNGN